MAEKSENTLDAARAETTGAATIESSDMMGDFVRDLVTGNTPPDAGKTEGDQPPGKEEVEPAKPDAEKEKPAGETKTDEDEFPAPTNASKTTLDGWDILKQDRKKYKEEAAKLAEELKAAKVEPEEVKTLRARVQEFEQVKGKIALIPELEEKVKNYEELETMVTILKFEASPEYQKVVGKPLDLLSKSADALARANETSVVEFFAALQEPELAKQWAMLKEVTAGWDEFDRGLARKMAEDTRLLLDKQEEMREKAAEVAKEHEKLTTESAENAKKQAKAEFSEAGKHVLAKLKDSIPFIPLREGETHDERLAAIAEKLKQVDFDNTSHNNKAFAAAAALYLPTVLKMLAQSQKEVETMKSRVKKDHDTDPSIKDKGAEKVAAPEDEDFFVAMGIPRNPTISEALHVKG